MMEYTLYFENSSGNRRMLAQYAGTLTERDAITETCRTINEFCEERNFKINYTRLWNYDGETVFDVGSHTEFFYLSPAVTLC